MKRNFSLLLILFTLAGGFVVSRGQSAGSPTQQKLADVSAGYSFLAPSGWRSNQGAEGFALVNPSETIVISVRSHGYRDFEAVVRDTKFEAGFEVAGKPQDLKGGGKAIRVTKRTQDGVGVIDFFVSFSPYGGGVVVMALSDSANSDASFHAGLKLNDSLVFTKPRQTSAADSPWQAALAGKHLLYLYSGNGYFEEKHIYLCRSGSFIQTTGSGGFNPADANDGSFAARGGKRGQWSVTGSSLVLRFQDGSVGNYTITERQASNEIGLNGRKYFVQSNAGC